MLIFKIIKNNIPKLIRFSIVGSAGAAINIVVYFITSEKLLLGINLSAVCAFCVAVSSNYTLNHIWTFKEENEDNSINLIQFIYYILGNISGLIISLAVLNIVVAFAGYKSHYFGQAIGITVGMLSNFMFTKKIVFKDLGAKISS